MLPIRWDPLKELSTLQKEMDNLFRKSFGLFEQDEQEPVTGQGRWMMPTVDAYVKEQVFHIKAELPGVDKNDIDVNIDGNILTLRGVRKEDKETKSEDYHMRESRYGSFVRKLTLPDGANADEVHASFENGILEITMPLKKKALRGRKVMIEGVESSKAGKKVH